MHIVLGASGQIGSMLIDNLLRKDIPVRAVVRNMAKAEALKNKGAEVVTADYTDLPALKKALSGGSPVFLLTPENPASIDRLGEIKTIINNYKEAVKSSGVKRIIGLSSMGAHNGFGRGALEASYLLEHAFKDIDAEQVFIRPAFYYSNWLGYLELVKEKGILPTFFPPDLKVPMIAPPDVAAFLTDAMTGKLREGIYEISGPRDYSSNEIADIFGKVLNRDAAAQQIMPEDWESALLQAGFSRDGAKSLMLMTQAVIEGKTNYETANPVHLPANFETYLRNII